MTGILFNCKSKIFSAIALCELLHVHFAKLPARENKKTGAEIGSATGSFV